MKQIWYCTSPILWSNRRTLQQNQQCCGVGTKWLRVFVSVYFIHSVLQIEAAKRGTPSFTCHISEIANKFVKRCLH